MKVKLIRDFPPFKINEEIDVIWHRDGWEDEGMHIFWTRKQDHQPIPCSYTERVDNSRSEKYPIQLEEIPREIHNVIKISNPTLAEIMDGFESLGDYFYSDCNEIGYIFLGNYSHLVAVVEYQQEPGCIGHSVTFRQATTDDLEH